MSPSEAAYVQYLIAYDAFMNADHDSRESLDEGVKVVHAAADAYRAARLAEDVVVP